MDDKRRQELRRRYIRLIEEADRIMDGYDCGRALAAHINPRLSEIDRELGAIQTEVLERPCSHCGAPPYLHVGRGECP